MHVLFSLEVYQSAFQAFSQCKAIHLLVTALEQDEKLAGIRFQIPFQTHPEACKRRPTRKAHTWHRPDVAH